MRWQGRRKSDNVVDARRSRGGRLAVGGGVGGLVLIVVISLLLGRNPLQLLEEMGGPGLSAGGQRPLEEETEVSAERREFVSVVLADTEDVWTVLFQGSGKAYQEPRLVLFSGGARSACGFASSAVGPFYCPADQRVYLDMTFFDELERKFGAPGDFAQAYVIAHEVGHHVQNLLGISGQVQEARTRLDAAQSNEVSVRLELQADYLAGVWAHHAQRMKNILEEGDLEEALGAANAIGDDTLQKQAQGHVVPDSFTHGSSEQRIRWFTKGLRSGDFGGMDEAFSLAEEEL